ncbi:MAG: hypothetical protein ABIU63_06790 [Chitinophagaceae bacterium]
MLIVTLVFCRGAYSGTIAAVKNAFDRHSIICTLVKNRTGLCDKDPHKNKPVISF